MTEAVVNDPSFPSWIQGVREDFFYGPTSFPGIEYDTYNNERPWATR